MLHLQVEFATLIREELKLAGMTLRIIYNDAHTNSTPYLKQRQQAQLS